MSHVWTNRERIDDGEDSLSLLGWLVVVIGLLVWAVFDYLLQGGVK